MSGDFFTKHVKLKVVSLLLALFLEFYFISPSNLLVTTVSVPIEILNVPQNLIVLAPDVQNGAKVDVKLRGPAPLLDQIRQSSLRFRLRLPDDVGLERIFPLSIEPDQLTLPSGVTCVDYNPSSIEVRLDRLVRRELPITARRDGEVASGLELEEIKIQPLRATVSGPESELRELQSVETELIDLTGLQVSKVVELPIRITGSKSTVIPALAKVELVVGAKLMTRAFDNVRIEVRGGNGIAVQFHPSQGRVIAKASPEVLKQIDEKRLKITVDASDLGDGEHQAKAEVAPLAGVRSLVAEPAEVTVTVARGVSRSADRDSVEARENLAENAGHLPQLSRSNTKGSNGKPSAK